jgi:H/ACA ribonucleoprotein complex subunit 4
MKDAEWYTRQESETSEEYGQIPEKRDPEELLRKGIVLIDKPFGPTSKQVSTWIKEELDLKKAGHFGTLDPNATGVLPVGLNKGTRINEALAQSDKQYVVEAHFEESFSEEKYREVLARFEGTNTQTPPEKSAVKREERERELYSAELIEADEDRMLARIDCESGFYVRVLIQQIAEELKTEGEMEELRRTRQASLEADELTTLQDLVDAYHYYVENDDEEKLREIVHPVERGVRHLRKIAIKDSAVNAVANGADLGAGGISKFQDGIQEGDTVAITTLKGELVALATAQMNSEQLYDSDDTAATLNSVHLDPETYPRRWKQ